MPVNYTKPPPKKAAPDSEYDIILSGKVGTGIVETQKLESGQPAEPKKTKTEQLPIPPPTAGPQCVVRFGVGRTINIGDFESIRIYVGIDYPCAVNDSAIEDAYDKITTWAGEKLNEAYEAART